LISIDSIITPGDSRAYLITNADGKSWLLPAAGLSIGLELYQPSGIKGRLLKQLLPLLHRMPGVTRAIHASYMRVALRPDIVEAAERVFGIKGIEFSIFGGTPSVHQKITIQFSLGHRILGYCKLSDSDDIRRLFVHERDLLARLSAAGTDGIPHCLLCETLSDGTHIFIQSTVKTPKSYSPHHWTPLHESFLQQLSVLTRVRQQFESTDLHTSLSALKDNMYRLPARTREIIATRLDKIILEKTSTEVEYSAYHADFTPWNMTIEDNRLFVFDWEYGRLSYPPMLDRYHFFIQQALHVTNLKPDKIHRLMSSMPWYTTEDYTIYLLDIISRFTLRENGELSQSFLSMLEVWTDLLERVR
jgi:hypothetical protein